MIINTDLLISMTEANQNFSKVAHLVEQEGMAVILKNNRPRYVVVDFAEYESILQARKEKIDAAVDAVLEENMEAFLELAK